MNSTGNIWVIVLAAGEGRRLHCFTTSAAGEHVPKQYCSLHGGPSLLADALQRARRIARPEHICVVVAAAHERYWHDELQELAPHNVIVQPENRGTAIGILLPLLHVLRHEPGAHVVLLPSDHFVADEARLATALRSALQVVNLQPHKITLLGITPDSSDPEFGYIVPGAVNGPGTQAVLRFVEKPPLPLATELVAAGALWNAFIVAAEAATLATLFRTHVPQLYAQLQGAGSGSGRLGAIYQGLPVTDFSRDILEGSEPLLRVLAVGQCGWTDLGTPQRVCAVLATADERHAGAASLDLASQVARQLDTPRCVTCGKCVWPGAPASRTVQWSSWQ